MAYSRLAKTVLLLFSSKQSEQLVLKQALSSHQGWQEPNLRRYVVNQIFVYGSSKARLRMYFTLFPGRLGKSPQLR